MWNHSTKMKKFTVQFLCSKTALLEGNKLASPHYSAVGKSWWLSAVKVENKSSDDGEEYIGLYLHASLNGPKKVDVRFALRLIASCYNKNLEDKDEEQACVFDCQNQNQNSDNVCWGCETFVPLATLKSDKSVFCFKESAEDKFLFEADVTVVSVDGIPIVHPPIFTFHPKTAVSSISDSKEAHLSNDSTLPVEHFDPEHDVVVVSKCGVEFECHKYILARNAVFQNVYLQHVATEDLTAPAAKKQRSSHVEMKSKSDRIVLKDMSADALRVVLSHIYHGSLKFDIAIAGDVLHAAQTHDLPLLKRECEAFMSYSLNMDNLLDYLMIAELTNSKTLKDACLSFWPKCALNIMKTDVWKDFITSKDLKNVVLIENLIEQLLKMLSQSRC